MNKNWTRRQFLKATGGGLIATSATTKLLAKLASPNPPNLVFVFPDQMRGTAMGFVGQEPVITPNLDGFAEESLVLTDAVSNYPICSPYRAMLMTGKYPHANKVRNNCYSKSAVYGCELPESARCWSDVLKDRDYSLGYIGKWHLDAPKKPYVKSENNEGEFAWNEWCPPNRRHSFDFWYSYGTYDRHFTPMYWATDSSREKPIRINQWGPEHEADVAIKYISNEGGKYRKPDTPFALVVSMNPPHMPYSLVPQKYVDMYKDKSLEELTLRPNIPAKGTKWGDYYRKHIRNYFAMITGVDDQFGRILKALKDEGLEKDTIVVFTSDHGNSLGSHEHISKNTHYEESMRIPFLIRWAGEIKPRQDDLLISVPDVYPTLLNLMGFAEDIPKDVQGTSYASLFLTGRGKRPTSQLYFRITLGKPAWGRRGVRTHRYTLMINKTQGKPTEYVLHDNTEDPYQLKNITDEKPQIVKELTGELEKWLRKTNDPWLNSL